MELSGLIEKINSNASGYLVAPTAHSDPGGKQWYIGYGVGILYYISYIYGDVITYPCYNRSVDLANHC